MTTQMIFALTYVPCVAFVGMSYAFGGLRGRILEIVSLIFGVIALCSYLVFLLAIVK